MSNEFDEIVSQLHALAASRKQDDRELVRKHLFGDGIHLYVRINRRHCGLQLLDALVMADITVAEGSRRQGVFTRLLSRLEGEVPAMGLQAMMVENVVNPHLLAYLERNGYKPGWEKHTVFKESPYG